MSSSAVQTSESFVHGPLETGYPVTLPKISPDECRYVDFINHMIEVAATQHRALKSLGWLKDVCPPELSGAYENFYSESLFGTKPKKTESEYDEVFETSIRHILWLKEQMQTYLRCQVPQPPSESEAL